MELLVDKELDEDRILLFPADLFCHVLAIDKVLDPSCELFDTHKYTLA
jgi:hypothetical protein